MKKLLLLIYQDYGNFMKYSLKDRILQKAFINARDFLFNNPNYDGDMTTAFKSHFNIKYDDVRPRTYDYDSLEFESEEDMFLFLMEWS